MKDKKMKNKLIDIKMSFLTLFFIVCHVSWIVQGFSIPLKPKFSMELKASNSDNNGPYFLGFDLGTSGARISIIEKKSSNYKELYTDSISWTSTHPYDDPKAWIYAMDTMLQTASETTQKSNEFNHQNILQNVKAVCASGTSASCLLIDSQQGGQVTRKPRMYNYDIVSNPDHTDSDKVASIQVNQYLEKHAPSRHTARAPTGSLAKLLLWQQQTPLKDGEEILSHQSDYCVMHLLYDTTEKQCGSGLQQRKRYISSDWHNCLKLGYDVQKLEWPLWLISCLKDAGITNPNNVLPSKVVSPGQRIGTVASSLQQKYGFPDDCVVVGGTTDSNAAFFAAIGGTRADFGTAVTSLGSTLAIKLLSQNFCEDADRGVYSHRFPLFDQGNDDDDSRQAWLVGGASNVGCAVLRQQHFSNDELVQLSKDIDPDEESPLKYYPLTKIGERFPTADSSREPCLTPMPEDRKEYLHGILQGISDVEKEGFEVLGDLGAGPPRPKMVWSCGGGANNDMWLKMRQNRLSSMTNNDDANENTVIPVARAENTEASFGAAILAAGTF